jgi:hypothetical protein
MAHQRSLTYSIADLTRQSAAEGVSGTFAYDRASALLPATDP